MTSSMEKGLELIPEPQKLWTLRINIQGKEVLLACGDWVETTFMVNEGDEETMRRIEWIFRDALDMFISGPDDNSE